MKLRWMVLLLAAASCTSYGPLERAGRDTGSRATGAVARPMPDAVVVRRGDTLSGIAATYGISLGDIVSVNPELRPDRIRPGQTVRLPPDEEPMKAAPPLSPAEIARTEKANQTKPPSLTGDGFLTPVSGTVISGFGDKPDGTRNDGVNVAASRGTAIRAAENGVVVYAGDRIPGFGNMVLIRHAQDLTTMYAHAQTLTVETGDVVERGQRIGTVGSTGQVRVPQLHFELREGRVAVDPARSIEGWGPTEVAGS